MAESLAENKPLDDKPDFFRFFADPQFSAFLEAEVKYRVSEQLRVRHLVQNATVAAALLLACMGLALAGNTYFRLREIRTKNDQLATTLTNANAVLKVLKGATSSGTPAKGSE